MNQTYTLLEEIGHGGGGIVYKAYHERLKKYVIVKQIRENVKGILESRGEADILKNISQTYLPQVYDFLEIDGDIFTIMDYIPGENLEQALAREGCFSQKRVLKWLRQLSEALSYLHSQNPPIIHSDIKPANIMLTPEDNICLIDFNISLAFEPGLKTSTGISAGYSPPEQYRDVKTYQERIGQRMPVSKGSGTELLNDRTELLGAESELDRNPQTESMLTDVMGRGVDERSDIYSLGATMYRLLTGEKPSADFEQIMSITAYSSYFSEGLILILQKMMELDPDQRYQNGMELFAAVTQIEKLDREYIRFWKRERRRKIVTGICLAAGIGLMVSGYFMFEKEKARTTAELESETQKLIDDGDYDEAKSVIKKICILEPRGIEGPAKEIYRLYRMGDYEKCSSYGMKVLNYVELSDERSENLVADSCYMIGNAYFEQKDYQNAAKLLKTALELFQENSLYYRDYAITLARMGYPDKAEEQLEYAVDIGLGEDSIYLVQGEIDYSRQNYDAAAEKFQKAIRTAEDDDLELRAVLLCSDAYRALGDSALEQEIEVLEGYFRKAGTGNLYAEEKLADAYARKGKQQPEYYREALSHFQSLYDKGYSTRQMLENLVILHQQLDQFDEAERLLVKMTDEFPEDYRGYKRLAFLEIDKQQKKANAGRDYRMAKSYYEKARALYESFDPSEDAEMVMLDRMMNELRDKGWL